MKILMPSNISHGTKVFNDDGTEVKGLVKVVVTAELDQPVTADLHLSFIDATEIMDAEPCFMVGAYRDVVGVILKDGTKVDLESGEEIA